MVESAALGVLRGDALHEPRGQGSRDRRIGRPHLHFTHPVLRPLVAMQDDPPRRRIEFDLNIGVRAARVQIPDYEHFAQGTQIFGQRSLMVSRESHFDAGAQRLAEFIRRT